MKCFPGEVYELPAVAVNTLSDQGLLLELHSISISHYCMRAAWALKAAGLPYKQISYLPLLHVFGIKRLQARFQQGPGAATASSSSPFATPVLAIYTAKKEPLCLISNSSLISRYAALRAQALQLPHTLKLYGGRLILTPTNSSSSSSNNSSSSGGDDGDPPCGAGAGRHIITGSANGALYDQVTELELRLSGTMGVEVRRVMYHYLLPSPGLAGLMFSRNSSSTLERLCSPLVYLICTVLLRQAMNINAKTAARGMQRLREEFDFFDQMLSTASRDYQQHQAQANTTAGSQGAGAATDASSSSSSSTGAKQSKLPCYLCGFDITAADVSLACLAGYVVGVPGPAMGLQWSPEVNSLPRELREFMQELRQRPTGRFVLDMWDVHGPFGQKSRAPGKQY